MRGIIYKWTNKTNNKSYIGKTARESERVKEHLRDRRYNSPFHKALDKYGVDNFIYEVLFEFYCNDKQQLTSLLNEKEQYFIQIFKSNNKQFGYNLTDGGDGQLGYKCTEEGRKKRSESKMGEKNPMFNKTWTDEQRKKLMLTRYGHKPYNNKQVVQMSDDGKPIQVFESALKAAEHFGNYNNRSNITKACKQGRKAFGYKWKYLKEIEDNVINKSETEDDDVKTSKV